MEYMQEERLTEMDRTRDSRRRNRVTDDDSEDDQLSRWTVFGAIWRTLLLLSEDPFPDVAARARAVIDGVFNSLAALPRDVLEELPLAIAPKVQERAPPLQPPPAGNRVNGTTTLPRSNTAYPAIQRSQSRPVLQTRPTSSGASGSGGGLYNTLKRTASVAYNLALGVNQFPKKRPPSPMSLRKKPNCVLRH